MTGYYKFIYTPHLDSDFLLMSSINQFLVYLFVSIIYLLDLYNLGVFSGIYYLKKCTYTLIYCW